MTTPKAPFLSDSSFLNQIERFRSDKPGDLCCWWLGQSGFIACHQGETILFDPYLSDSLTAKYANTDKPHVRMTGRVVAPDTITGLTHLTASHAHTDHLDSQTLRPLIDANPGVRLVGPSSLRELIIERSGLLPKDLILLDHDNSIHSGNLIFHGIASAHNELATDDHGRHLYLGFVVEWGDFTIYHSGDTLDYAGLDIRLRPFDIDLAFLPINGNLPSRNVSGNLWGREAAALARRSGLRRVIPCHYDMFEFNTTNPGEFAATCLVLRQSFTLLENGQGCVLQTDGACRVIGADE